MYSRIWQGIKAHGWIGSRTVCAVRKVEIVKYAWLCKKWKGEKRDEKVLE